MENPGKKVSVRFVSLGCPKNLVDSEVMLGQLAHDNFTIVPPDASSEVGVVNTCGFIDASKQESIDTILELAKEKQEGKLKLLVVSGCLSQRYEKELPQLIPEVDAFIGTGDFTRLSQIIRDRLLGNTQERNFIRAPSETISWDLPRMITTPFYTRYVKVSEGCSHTCSFCTIPLMRGGLKSRATQDILNEMQAGIEGGTKEFNLIAQDLNEYGRDLEIRESLYGLLEKTASLKGDFWIRLMYMYPLQFPDKLIRLIKNHPHVIPYVDIPLQHIDDRILKSMRRGSSSAYIHRLIGNLKKEIPNIVLRTTFIVGYPGETDEEFEKLLDFVKEYQFDRLGAFTYSQEEQTLAGESKDQIPQRIKEERKDRLMQLQQKISLEKNRGLVGKEIKVLFEEPMTPQETPLGNLKGVKSVGAGRYYGQAPDIDGQVYVKSSSDLQALANHIGQFVPVTITQAMEYDLVGEINPSPFAV